MRPDTDYDIGEAFEAIEKELIASMIRNMDRHRAEEDKEGILWSQWQAEQLRALEEYKLKNKEKYGKQFKSINLKIAQVIRLANATGNMDQEIAILEAIKNGFHGFKKVSGTLQGEFFRLNERKLGALIKATTDDMKKAEVAVLRMANDQYRKVIYNAQVYANTGAGTYEKAVDMATRDMLAAGLNCVQYSNGARHTLADYADMAIRTASKRAYLQGEGTKRQEWGISTVILNKRGDNPCPKCLPFVGKVLIDDVWSGGSPRDGPYPLMSTAIAAGLYHPRCKDSHTTYFPGISTADDTWTKEELEEVEKAAKKESKQQYAKRQQEKCERLEEFSLDAENKKCYGARAKRWKQIQKDLTPKSEKEVAKADGSDIIELTEKELGAILRYKSPDSYLLNDKLRTISRLSELSESDREFVNNLDSALDKAPKYKGDLVRTVDFTDYPNAAERTVKFLEAYQVGKIISHPQFFSTSKTGDYSETANIKIRISTSTKGCDISGYGLDEGEVLYKRNEQFEVVAKSFINGAWYIILREV